VLGLIKDKTGSFPLSLLPLAALTAAGAITVLLLGRSQKRTSESAAEAEAFPGSRRSSA
jgi:hypothetical protein